ncbi:hypothetical protein HS088_TW02G00908 [Tripterygium wilfordii]|uniref:Uncharacterized protein n=1 Tax=Tripterygium wilfordii TaxID=458696 RepID=A0A7J7E031_TRIWF|nr:uncharacterized protein LOC120005375 [Tripterygium wilfordii]KAF5751889.1 hypothetical protein HS088_TW02G00908 [Tripterygium wilfordii]
MEIPCYDNLKRYWRRRQYQRLINNRRKIKVVRLGGRGGGGGPSSGGRSRRIRILIPKLRLKSLSPIKLLARLHDAYIDMMIRFAVSSNNTKLFAGSKVARNSQQVSMVSSGEQVDTKFVMEIYKRLAPSMPEVRAF